MQLGFYSFTWAHKMYFSRGRVSSNLKKIKCWKVMTKIDSSATSILDSQLQTNVIRIHSIMFDMRTEACSLAVLARFPCLCIMGSSLSVHVCHPRGALPVYWACRVFSESGN
jgi:hypothetical protein